MDLIKVEEFIKNKHAGQKRKQGTPYHTHPISVAKILKNKGFDETYQATGLTHDLLEDTDATELEILDLASLEVLKATKLLTKKSGYIMSEYIENISKNPIAKIVKLVDRIHNLEESLTQDDNFKKKYLKETYEWFIPLSKGTIFEKDLLTTIIKIEKSLNTSKFNI